MADRCVSVTLELGQHVDCLIQRANIRSHGSLWKNSDLFNGIDYESEF